MALFPLFFDAWHQFEKAMLQFALTGKKNDKGQKTKDVDLMTRSIDWMENGSQQCFNQFL